MYSLIKTPGNLGMFYKLKNVLFFGIPGKKSATVNKLYALYHLLFAEKSFIYFTLFVPGVLKRTHPKAELNRSSAVGPRNINPVDILKNLFISRVSSTFS